MTQEEKNKYLFQAKKILTEKTEAIKKEIEHIPQEAMKLRELFHGSAADELTYQTMTAIYRKRYNDLLNLCPSPYFYSCLVKFDGEKIIMNFILLNFLLIKRLFIPGHRRFPKSDLSHQEALVLIAKPENNLERY
ncbi:MAG TPA: hypothetical protein PK619_01850 [bacterium]|nr:hypothetical protein [bacterium]HPN81147.1 hypothetical protein [bacterium]HPW39442.1 hypothetical protein [bacterium]HQA63620.1 hypothetical protein [bacterium]